MTEPKEDWEYLQKKLGCKGCSFCDPTSLFQDRCCTYKLKLRIDKNGKCLVRIGKIDMNKYEKESHDLFNYFKGKNFSVEKSLVIASDFLHRGLYFLEVEHNERKQRKEKT